MVLVDRGSLEPWLAGKDLLLCRDHFPFHKDLYLPDLDLLRHQAPDFLAPEKCQSFSSWCFEWEVIWRPGKSR